MHRCGSAAALFGFLSVLWVGGLGCSVVEEPQPLLLVADLEVTWAISGSTDPALCDFYGIDSWVVEARGPDVRDSETNCRFQSWTTASDLFALAEGNYQITVRALSFTGLDLAAQSVNESLIDTGFTQQLFLEFLPGDFGF